MSAVAYERSFEGLASTNTWWSRRQPERALRADGQTERFDEVLRAHGWTQWNELTFTERAVRNARKHHLRVHVFEKVDGGRLNLVVAFGGTDPRNLWDWLSNFRWLIPWHNDEYTIVVKDFVGPFQDRLRDRARQLKIDADKIKLCSTGHSLGGGLAQQFAYAAPVKPTDVRVGQVFAFDPSPVTGFYSVDKSVRERARRGLDIDRPFEINEILSYLRMLTAFIFPPSTRDPAVRGIRYNLLSTTSLVGAHSIPSLAEALYRKSAIEERPDEPP